MNTGALPTLLGRERETAILDELIARVRGGRGGVLVLRGEAGIGKTALLDALEEKADGFTVLRGGGVESEADLPFAAIHRMCSQVDAAGFFELPDPQVAAVTVAFGMSSGPPPDPFLVSLGVLNRLSGSAEERPLVCIVDDAQWLDRDSAQILAFAARRLEADAVAIVFAVREPIEQLRDLPELRVSNLSMVDSRSLLADLRTGPLDESVREQFIAEAHGNPLALLELPRGPGVAGLIGGRGDTETDASRVAELLDASFRRRYEDLPAETRTLLLVAAAEPTGAPDLLWGAAKLLGIDHGALDPGEAAGLIAVADRSVFRHPAVRSSIYASATAEEKRQAHRALADATDREIDFDRRAWHRALGTVGFDAEVADELSSSAARARARGGMAVAAGFLAKAAVLTPDLRLRGERALAAANFFLMIGSNEEALEVLAMAEAAPLDPLGQARLDLARVQAGISGGGYRDGAALLLTAAQRLDPLEPKLSTQTAMEALGLATFTAAAAPDLTDAAEAICARSSLASGRPGARDPLLKAAAGLVVEGYAKGAPGLAEALGRYRSAVDTHCSDDDLIGDGSDARWLSLGVFTAIALWDLETWEELANHQVRVIRRGGDLSMLAIALTSQALRRIYAGELVTAGTLVKEIEILAEATYSRLPRYAEIALAARGNHPEAANLLSEGTQRAEARGESLGVSFLEAEAANLNNALGRYEEALRFACKATQNPTPHHLLWLPDLVEAAVRNGEPEQGEQALAPLTALAESVDSEWARGMEQRARALLAEGEGAEDSYTAAIGHLERTPAKLDLARSHLLFGEWLRREGRRSDARISLRISHQAFEAIAVPAYAKRAARELAATGERVRRRTPDTREDLTERESQIAGLAAVGLSNRRIGEQLYISHRTVGYHLGKVFTKLDVENRAQLHGALDGVGAVSA